MYRKASLGAPAQLEPELGDPPIKHVVPAWDMLHTLGIQQQLSFAA